MAAWSLVFSKLSGVASIPEQLISQHLSCTKLASLETTIGFSCEIRNIFVQLSILPKHFYVHHTI
jgi:hypothetical protein